MNDQVLLPCIYVLAGTNGAGKSSVVGARLSLGLIDSINAGEIAHNIESSITSFDRILSPNLARQLASSIARQLAKSGYFNPDEVARIITSLDPKFSQDHANSLAWYFGKTLLEQAIKETCSFAIETTLGGKKITQLLQTALLNKMEVRMSYVGLDSPERHIARVKARVARGGHPIPEDRIRKRYESSRENLISLLPHLTELRMYDNSYEADPFTGATPKPTLILHVKNGKIESSCDSTILPEWTRPIWAAALTL